MTFFVMANLRGCNLARIPSHVGLPTQAACEEGRAMKKDYESMSRAYGEAKAVFEQQRGLAMQTHEDVLRRVDRRVREKWSIKHAHVEGGVRDFAVVEDGDGFKAKLFTLFVASPSTLSEVAAYGREANPGAARKDAAVVPVELRLMREGAGFSITSELLDSPFVVAGPDDVDGIDRLVDLLHDGAKKSAIEQATARR
jgi:hypothetical protein